MYNNFKCLGENKCKNMKNIFYTKNITGKTLVYSLLAHFKGLLKKV